MLIAIYIVKGNYFPNTECILWVIQKKSKKLIQHT